MFSLKKIFIYAILFLTICPAIQAAETQQLNSGNTAWVLISTALILFMAIPGLSMFYGGLVRDKNKLSIYMQCFTIVCVVSILWLCFGYSFAFTNGGGFEPFVGGYSRVFFNSYIIDKLHGDIPEISFFGFQMMFAVITPALMVGAIVGRMKFSALILFVALWTIFVYIPVCHWIWGGGWLQQLGVIDFAGGIVIHTSAGVSAIVAAIFIGRRRGFPKFMQPNSIAITVMGAGMLWVGWFGFNAGSVLAANSHAAQTLIATHVSAAAAGVTWFVIDWIRSGKPTVIGIVTGAVAGLASVTPASGYIGPFGALVIGICAGGLCFLITYWIKEKIEIDDSLDVFSVHGVGGMMGSLLAAVFGATVLGGRGLAEGMTIMKQLGVQALAVVVVAIWSILLTYLILKACAVLLKGVRVSKADELVGLDISQHGSS